MKHLWPHALVLFLCIVFLGVAVGVGPGDIDPFHAWGILWHNAFGATEAPVSTATIIVRDLRLPRAILSFLLGGCLGVAGTVTQGLFRNALAEPGVLGVSMGAAALAVLGFFWELDSHGLWVKPVLAATGAFITLALLFGLIGNRGNLLALLLAGVAIASLCAALITLVLAVQVDRWELGTKVMAWLMGSFEGRGWLHVAWSIPPTLIGVLLAFWLRKDLDMMHLGVEVAASLGCRPERTRLLSTICIALLVGTATALAGVIGFVGLIVPHVARLSVGPLHGRLLSLSLLLGGGVLLAVDTCTRACTSILLPPGVITSLLGAPFFLWLLRRYSRQVSA
ncbi:MAG: iron ABC transporter permease [Myxococcota bacterium]